MSVTPQQLVNQLQVVHERISKLHDQWNGKLKEGSNYYQLKNVILLNYLMNLLNHINRPNSIKYRKVLSFLKLHFEKLIPLDKKLKHELDKAMQQTQNVDHRPKPEDFQIAEIDKQVYAPPKIEAANMEKKQERQAKRVQETDIYQSIKADLAGQPEEIFVSEGNRQRQYVENQKDRKKRLQRERYEEENFVRLPEEKRKHYRNFEDDQDDFKKIFSFIGRKKSKKN